jgi:hypothetical protein
MGSAFETGKKKVDFIGGPSDGDSIIIDDETFMVEVKNKADPTLGHLYIRADERTLVYHNDTNRETKE